MDKETIRPADLMLTQRDAYQQDVDYYRNVAERFEERACPGCSASNSRSRLFAQHQGFKFVRCLACWCVYMNPGPTDEILQDFYASSANYDFWAKSIYPETRGNRRVHLHSDRAAWIDTAVRREFGGDSQGTVLEVGAGTGDTLRELRQRLPGWVFEGIEPNPSMWSFWDDDLMLVKDFLDFDEGHADVDIVAAFEVVEHLRDPIEFFGFARRSLGSGNLLFISTPNAHSLELSLFPESNEIIDIEHISLLTPMAIHRLAAKTGFEVLSIDTPGLFDSESILAAKASPESFADAISCFATQHADELQAFVRKSGLSSHMKIVLRAV